MTGVSVDVEGNTQVVAFVPLDPRPPYLVVLAILVCVQAFYSNHLFDSSIRRGQALL